MSYVDGFVIAVETAKRETYRAYAAMATPIFKEYGALSVVEPAAFGCGAGVLPADDKSAEGLSFRKQLELHRTKASCAGCHEKIDPLGFGLENFDAIGRWRTKDANGQPVDSLATLPGDITFSSPAELKKLLAASDDLFLRNFSRKLLGYSLGRPLEYYDEPVVSDLVKTLRKNQLAIRPLIQAIVASQPFQNRSAAR